eukprot:5427523-Pyramimonas_sp.AAC.1
MTESVRSACYGVCVCVQSEAGILCYVHVPHLGHLGVEHLDVLVKANGEHLVRLVEDGELHLAKVQVPALHQVDHAPGGAHHNVHPAAQLAAVVHNGHAAVAAEQPQGGGRLSDLALHLQHVPTAT